MINVQLSDAWPTDYSDTLNKEKWTHFHDMLNFRIMQLLK